jgi:hypothetical protein
MCCKKKNSVDVEEFEPLKNPHGITVTESAMQNDLELRSVHGSDGNATMNEPVDPTQLSKNIKRDQMDKQAKSNF